jgi:gliding motility-associated-like protein
MMASKTFAQITNPAMPEADLITTCFDDISQMPKIFLCGNSDTRIITTNFPASTIRWQKFNEGSCSSVTDDCSDSNSPCIWTTVATSPNFNVTEAGHFKVIITNSDTTEKSFYFNVYQNGLNIPIIKTDIYCRNPGEIRVAQLTDYEYSIDGTNYQLSNVFSIPIAGDYTVKVRRVGATISDCVFEIPVTIVNKELDVVTTVTQPVAYGDKGTIKLTATNVREQYFYKIAQGATIITEVGPILDSEYPFPNLNAGTYTWSVKTDDCNWKSGDVTINSVSPFQITPTIQPITCQPGSIQVVVTGGTAPYQYFFNGNTTPTSNLIPVTLAGTYTAKVVDNNGLTDQITVTVPLQPAPVYTIEKSNLNCYYPNTWQIKFNVTNDNGNSLRYSINNGATFSDNPVFQGLSATPAGTTFKTIIEYTYGGVKCTKVEDVTLVQPQFGLSATAGVSELIGCLPAPDEDKAKIRITNPQGGIPPYKYSFDNQATWESNTFVLKPAGDYIFHIKDATGCISAMPKVVVENIGVPTITVTTDSFNCDGTANTTINSTTGTSTTFSYTYSLDGGPFQSTPNFSNISSGNHTIGINYQPLIVPTYSNLLKEDFGYGPDTTSPGMSAAYCFERQVSPVTCNVSRGWGIEINDGEYSVTSYIKSPFGVAWHRPIDHTDPSLPKGRYLVVNIQGNNTRPIIYEKTINEIIPNQPISVEFYATNLLRIGNTQYNSNLRVAIVNAAGVEIDFYQTGPIPKTETWRKYSTQLNPGNNTTLKFQIRSIEQNGSGNDVAIDDISAYQIPKLCAATKTINFTVPTGKAFEASITNTKNATCSGANNGEITIAAQNFNTVTGYQYSKDNGATWQTIITSPFTISGLVVGTYAVKVRYSSGKCEKFISSITITVPTPLVTSANVTTLATCNRGATITANSTGGTPFYQYELWDELNTTKIRLVQNSGVFEDVPVGTYSVRGLDANGCGNTTPVSITVVPPPIPVPSLDSTLDLCYDAVNQAKIKINVSSGTAPFSYSLNGGALQNSNTFLNVGPGTHIVDVVDSNNCKATTQNIEIGNELKVTAVLTKALDCTTSPNAVITVNLEGGARPLRYQVKQGSTILTTTDIAIPNTNSSFTYSVSDSQIGTYSFIIIDANGCSKTTAPVTVNSKIEPVISSITQTQSILCHGGSTAAIQVNLDTSKGVGPFTYSVKDIISFPAIILGNQLTSLAVGTYEVTVTDSNSCTAKENITISEPLKLVVQSHAVPITCDINNGQSKGSVVVDGVSGGVASYNYFVTGVNGYANSELNTSGSTSYTFDVVDFGLYQINVVDTNGCSVLIQDVLVASPPTDLNIGVTTSTISCLSGGTAEVQVVPTSTIIGPFHFAIYTGPGMTYSSGSIWKDESFPGSLKTTFTGLIPGVKYTFIVYDETTKCYHYKTAESAIATNSTLEVNNLEAKNISCKGRGDGKVSFTIRNNYSVATLISYQVYNSQSLDPVTGISGSITMSAMSSTTITDLGPLPFGNYIVLIKEGAGATNEGCSIASNTFNITESAIDLSLLPKVIKNVNCHEYGVISVQAKDGTAPYQYLILAVSGATSSPISSTGLIPPPPPSPDGVWQLTNTFTVNQGGSYTVFVKDAYGCEKFQTIIVTKDSEPVIDLTVTDICVNEGKFEINISETTAGIQPYYLSVNGSVFSTATLPYTLSNQNSGNYTIAIKDVNGCTNTQNKTIYSPLGLSSTVIKQPTCALNDGKMDAIPVGGSGSFEYKIDSGSYGLSPNFTGLSSGAHTIYIKDTRTLCEKSILVTLEFPTAVTGLALSQKPVTCNGGNDGSITATIATPAPGVNDNPVYTYSLNGGTPQTSNIFSGLATGSYTVKVISGRGCVDSKTISVTEPAVISVPAPTVVEFGCNSTNNLNNASITISGVSGGSNTFTQYEFIKNGTRVQFGPNPTYIETDLNGGTYDIKVYDDKGCSGSTLATIQPFYILDKIIVNALNTISCAASEAIQISVLGIGGTPTNIEYSLSAVSGSLVGNSFSSNPTGIFSGLTVGEYLITAKNTVTSCTIQDVYTVNEPNTFNLTIDSVVDVTCFGGTNGSANITLIDRNTPSKAGAFSYTINDSSGNLILTSTVTNAGPIAIPGLKADVYSITATLTTTPFCSVTKKFTISQPTSALSLAESHSDITCVVGNNDGTITALPTGGWSDFYEFKWEKDGMMVQDWSDVYELTNLTQGIYKVHVRDAKGCEETIQVVLNNPLPITLTTISDKYLLECFADRNATITATNVVGGQGNNYWYSLNTIGASPSIFGPQASNEFKNLGAGTYTVTVTDNWSCTATSSLITINEPNNVVATLSLLTPPTCTIDAQLKLQITGGTSPYTFSADNIVFSPYSSSPLIGNPGVNRYYIKDSNGCGSYVSNDVVVESPKGLSVTIDTTFAKVNCFGESTASIVATAQGGLGNYSYTLLDELDNPLRPAQLSGTFSNLPAGKYKVKVTSADCIPADSGVITIQQPAAKLIPAYSLTNALCAGSNDGTITVVSSGGTVVIKQAISPNLSQFTESDLFENLAAGTYDVVVQDALGCYEKTTQVITQPNPIIASNIAASIVQEICFDDKNAAFSIDVSGGTKPYNVSLDNPSGPFTTGTAFQTQFDFTGLTGGSHTVYVQDANNCTFDWTVNLDESVKLDPTTTVDYRCVSNAQHNLVTVNLDPSITDFSLVQFSLDGGTYQPTNLFSNLTPGDHFIRVKHNNGCIKDTPIFNILKIDPLILSLKEGGLNEIIAVAADGGGNYKYTFDGEFTGSSPSYIYYKTQDYLVTVQDANGCTASVTQLFNYIDICPPNYFTPNGDGLNDTWAPGCTINYKNLIFSVLDRYGRELGTYHLGESWDGKYQGVELPSGDYWYVLKLNNSKDDREFVGHFTLYR